MENRRLEPYSSEYFEPVRDGGFTAEGFAIFYEKAKFDLVGREVMCFMEWGSLVRGCFLWQQITAFQKRESLVGECKNSGFLNTKTLEINLKVSISLHRFLFFTIPNTCSSSFSLLLAASSPHRNFDFPQNSIVRLICASPFAPVQNVAVRFAVLINFCQKF